MQVVNTAVSEQFIIACAVQKLVIAPGLRALRIHDIVTQAVFFVIEVTVIIIEFFEGVISFDGAAGDGRIRNLKRFFSQTDAQAAVLKIVDDSHGAV